MCFHKTDYNITCLLTADDPNLHSPLCCKKIIKSLLGLSSDKATDAVQTYCPWNASGVPEHSKGPTAQKLWIDVSLTYINVDCYFCVGFNAIQAGDQLSFC